MGSRTTRSTAAPKRVRAVTRERVIEAAERVFTQRGYRGASINQIAAESGYTSGALYSNFDSKAALFMAVTERRMERRQHEILDGLRAVDGKYTVHALAGLIDTGFDPEESWSIAGYEFAAEAMHDKSLAPRLIELNGTARSLIRDILSAVLADRDTPPDPPLERLVTLLQCLINGTSATLVYDHTLDTKAVIADGLALLLPERK